MTIDDEALREIAADYTREAGVRQLERALGKVLRKVATKLAAGAESPLSIGTSSLRDYLGRPRFTPESAERTSVPGVATGLAVTGMGGDVLFIEAAAPTAATATSGLTLTGQLGDVMKESAQIALSYVRAHASALGIEPSAARPDVPRARAGRCGAEGRAVGGRHHGDGAGLPGDRSTGALGRRHDR